MNHSPSERETAGQRTPRPRGELARLAAEASVVDIGARTPWAALRYTLGVALALGVGMWLGGATVGMAAASGAVNAANVGISTGLARPRGAMCISTLVLAGTAFLGSVTAPVPVLATLLLVLVGATAAELATRGTAASSIGVQGLVGYVTLGHFPSAVGPTALLCLAVVAGGALEVLLGVAARSTPVRLTVGRVPGLRHVAIDPGPQRGRSRHLPQRLARGVLHPDRLSRRHAARMVVCLLVADALGTWLPEARGYWIVLTVIVVLKPDWSSTASRSLARWVGTLAGALLGAGVVALIGIPDGWALIAVITVATWAMLAVENVNYGLFSTAVTSWVLVFLLVTQPQAGHSATERALDTTIGGLVCFVVHVVSRRRDPQSTAGDAEPTEDDAG